MIKRLQIKFISITMGIILVVFGIIFVVLNIFMFRSNQYETEDMLKNIAAHDGIIQVNNKPKDNRWDKGKNIPKKIRQSHSFYIKLNENNEIIDETAESVLGITEENAKELLNTTLNKNINKGNVDNYQFFVEEKDYGKIIVFAEHSIEKYMLSKLERVSLIVSVISFIIIFVIVIILSKWVINPVKEAFEKQKQFISDASHELKTPLTIISANADVLEGDIGNNKWLYHIKEQVNRMNLLVQDLLTLAKTDEGNKTANFSEFDLSSAILNSSLSFESRAYEEGKKLFINIDENIYYVGDENRIKQMISIFLDNAIKYSNDNGEIKISLKIIEGKKQIEIFNTGNGVSKEEQNKIFERFYCSDSSRSRETGGFGLGLSIAKLIVDFHKGKIDIKCQEEKWIKFIITL